MSEKNAVIAITDKIRAEALAQADEQVAAAKAQAQDITADYEAKAKEAYQDIIAQAKSKAVSIAERGVSQSEMDRRKLLLSARQECVAKAFDTALDMLCNLPAQERALLMVKSAAKYQTADAEYIFNAKDRKEIGLLVVETVNAIFKKQQIKETFSGDILEQVKKLFSGSSRSHAHCAALSEQVGDFAGGFILKQGDIEINCTFEVLIAGVRENLEGETSAILFS